MPHSIRLAGLLVIGAAGGCALTLFVAHAPETSAAAATTPCRPKQEEWVRRHWLPYDATRLTATLGVDRRTVAKWLRTDGHTLAQLAASHGHHDVDALAKDLVGKDDATLIGRAKDTLTQARLGRRMLLNVFANPGIAAHSQNLFDVSTSEFRAQRRAGRTAGAIAKQGGRSEAQVTKALDAFLRAEQAAGVKAGATSQEQADLTTAQQILRVPIWLDRAHKDRGGHHGG